MEYINLKTIRGLIRNYLNNENNIVDKCFLQQLIYGTSKCYNKEKVCVNCFICEFHTGTKAYQQEYRKCLL